MQTNIKYYVVEGWGTINRENEIKSPIKIVAIPSNSPYRPKGQMGHDSIRHLRKYDVKWKRLKATRSKMADAICEQKNIIEARTFIHTPNEKEFNEYAFDILQHSIHGKYTKEFEGLHLYTRLNKNITKIEITKQEDKNGVWEANVFVFNKKRNEAYNRISTFFPKAWIPDTLLVETFYAIKSIAINGIDGVYESNTLSGVPVKIVIKNKRLRSIYPIHQGPTT